MTPVCSDSSPYTYADTDPIGLCSAAASSTTTAAQATDDLIAEALIVSQTANSTYEFHVTQIAECQYLFIFGQSLYIH